MIIKLKRLNNLTASLVEWNFMFIAIDFWSKLNKQASLEIYKLWNESVAIKWLMTKNCFFRWLLRFNSVLRKIYWPFIRWIIF